MNLTIDGYTFPAPTHAGQYSAHAGAGTFSTWCAEQTQYLRFGEVITYDEIDGLFAWGIPISQSLDRLMSWAEDAGWPTNPDQSAAIQHDIWTILAGGEGAIETTGIPLTQHALLLHNATRQDLLVSQSLPEPQPMALLISGVLLLALFRLVRR